MVNMAEGVAHGNVSEKREILKELLEKQLVKGETWYLVAKEWYRRLENYLGLNEWDTYASYDEAESPGPIDNAPLYQDESVSEIKPKLAENLDYSLVSEAAWLKLVDWFGKTEQQVPVSRKVIEEGLHSQCKVEVYLREVKLAEHNGKTDKPVVAYFSRIMTVGDLEKEMRNIFKISDDVETRLWQKGNGNEELQQKKSACLKDVILCEVPLFIIEKKKADGTWSKNNKKTGFGQSDRVQASSISTRYGVGSYNYDHGIGSTQPGLCGLANLGNTCFMNSVLQCMSNTAPLTRYFMSECHMKELNQENPLGMYGEIAKAYGELIKQMWSGQYPFAAPRTFKTQVGKFAPQFCGFQQHDCQELLTFLLDGLHEDLNRIKKKPYIELKDADGRPDQLVAEEAWRNYKARNDSVIVDLFHGLLKSTVICPDCDKISITFDPFCNLSLPLPYKNDQLIEVLVYPLDASRKPELVKVTVPRRCTVRVFCRALANMADLDEKSIVLTAVDKYHFHKIFSYDEFVDQVGRFNLHAFEVTVTNWNDSDNALVAVYMSKDKNNSLLPLLINVPKKTTTYSLLYQMILKTMKRYLKIPENLNNYHGIENGMNGVDLENNEIEDVHMMVNGDDDALTEPNGDIDDAKIMQVEEPKYFGFKFVGNTGTEIRKSEDNGKPLDLRERSYVMIEWNKKIEPVVYLKGVCSERHSVSQSRFNKKTIQLSECLDLFTTKERLGHDNAWYCPTCKKHQQATKKFDLWSLPDILVIHLKRFSYNRYSREKLDNLVEFPLKGLSLEKHVINPNPGGVEYDLFGVANHYGGMGGGHYTAYCRNVNNAWYHFDDSNVSTTQEDSVVTEAAYVLMYQRRGTMSCNYNYNNVEQTSSDDEDMEFD